MASRPRWPPLGALLPYPLPSLFILLLQLLSVSSKAIDILDASQLEPVEPNYCNNSELLDEAGLQRSTLGQFLGYDCSAEFFHCRWQSDGFRTYRKKCKTGLVYDTVGTQNCNYDYNEDEINCPMCSAGEFACIVSEECVGLDRRCDGHFDCQDKTDEQNCEVCGQGAFYCVKSGECISASLRCDGERNCNDGSDEHLCKSRATVEQRFTCESRLSSVPMTEVCDGVPQCHDGSDEAYCEVGDFGGSPSSLSFSSNPGGGGSPSFPIIDAHVLDGGVAEESGEPEGEPVEERVVPAMPLAQFHFASSTPAPQTRPTFPTAPIHHRIVQPTFVEVVATAPPPPPPTTTRPPPVVTRHSSNRASTRHPTPSPRLSSTETSAESSAERSTAAPRMSKVPKNTRRPQMSRIPLTTPSTPRTTSRAAVTRKVSSRRRKKTEIQPPIRQSPVSVVVPRTTAPPRIVYPGEDDEVVVQVTSRPVAEDILHKIGARLNLKQGEISSSRDLLARIEKMLSEEMGRLEGKQIDVTRSARNHEPLGGEEVEERPPKPKWRPSLSSVRLVTALPSFSSSTDAEFQEVLADDTSPPGTSPSPSPSVETTTPPWDPPRTTPRKFSQRKQTTASSLDEMYFTYDNA